MGVEEDGKRAKVQLRASCRNCRRRKIKCTGTSPCSVCIDRQFDCIFEKQSKMGRPRQSPTIAFLEPKREIKIGEVLQNIYEEIFLDQLPTNSFSIAVKSCMQSDIPFLMYGEEEMKEQHECTPAVYDALFPLLIQELLEKCRERLGMAEQIGNLPVHSGSGFLAVALARDTSNPDFLGNVLAGSRINDLKHSEIEELERLWAAAHPLASLVSSHTLSSASDFLKRAMQILIVGEALTLKKTKDDEQCEIFIKASKSLFYAAVFPVESNFSDLLYICQISAFLCWHCISHTKVKEGMTYLALSCQLISRLQRQMIASELNNEEILSFNSLHAVLSLMTVWAFGQLNRPTGQLMMYRVEENKGMSQFLSQFTQIVSGILTETPTFSNIHDTDTHIEIIWSTLAMLPSTSKDTGSADLYNETCKQIVLICLLTPRNLQLTDQKNFNLLSQCLQSLNILKRIANEEEPETRDIYMLSKIRMQRMSIQQKDRHQIALQSTLASLLYETLSDAAIIMIQIAEQGLYSQEQVRNLSFYLLALLDAQVNLIAETPKVQGCRIRVLECKQKLLGLLQLTIEQWQVQLETSNISAPSFTNASTPLSNLASIETPDDNLLELLWGELDWDFKS